MIEMGFVSISVTKPISIMEERERGAAKFTPTCWRAMDVRFHPLSRPLDRVVAHIDRAQSPESRVKAHFDRWAPSAVADHAQTADSYGVSHAFSA
jgi:hypothetical protein